MPSGSRSGRLDRWRDYTTVGLMLLAALGSLFSFVDGFPPLANPGTAASVRAEGAISGLFFAGLFVLLGIRPRRYPGVWELAILHRVVLVGAGVVLGIGGATGAFATAVTDVLLLVILVAAYLFGRGYRAWGLGKG